MAKQLISFLVLLILLPGPLQADEANSPLVEEFITYYHRKPDPERVPAILDLVLKGEMLNDQQNEAPESQVLLAHAFGHMARSNPKLICLYEAHFERATEAGEVFLVEALRIFGDEATRRKMEKWALDPIYRNQQKGLEAAAAFLADPKRRLPRDRPAKAPMDLDLLWADLLTTGEYPPVARILDALDHEGSLREKLSVHDRERTNSHGVFREERFWLHFSDAEESPCPLSRLNPQHRGQRKGQSHGCFTICRVL